MNNLGEGPALRAGIRDPGACATPARMCGPGFSLQLFASYQPCHNRLQTN